MKNTVDAYGSLMKSILFILVVFVCCSVTTSTDASSTYNAGQFTSMPINIVEESAVPRVMINSSNDHQLYFKAYNDYTDLDGTDLDGDDLPEITYKNTYDYYGYFDSYKCYAYNADKLRFEPQSFTASKYCSGEWSGNFLNWVSMSRIDTIRKILFGGHRRVDTATETVLERAYLPHDAHSWAKYYNGSDLDKLTPFTEDEAPGGVTFCNTTDVNTVDYQANQGSEVYTEPPLIKTVKGDYSLWASGDTWQCTWASGSLIDNHPASNGNVSALSGISAASTAPPFTDHVGEGNYVARVQVCVSSPEDLITSSYNTKENCKRYPGPDALAGNSDDSYKPIGLLQTYGDENKMYFGMVAGTYQNHASGGDVIRNVASLNNEINVTTDGTFPFVAKFAKDNGIENNKAEGLINYWSLYRLVKYAGKTGVYSDCTDAEKDVTKSGVCQNWGNPFAEIYYASLYNLSGNASANLTQYRAAGDSNLIPGLYTPQSLKDPLDESGAECARLSVVNFNSSNISYDYDDLDGVSYGPPRIWKSDDLPPAKTTTEMTNYVGENEDGLLGKQYFIGEIDVTKNTDNEDQLCTAKTISKFGLIGGLCPEAPRLKGSYRIAGLAYYAHVKDIRPDTDNSRKLTGEQVVDTYSVAMATGSPVIEIPVSANASSGTAITIIPACRNTSLNPAGNCGLTDFKIIPQLIGASSVPQINNDSEVSGKVYISWDSREQGGDFDQDMWGTLSYKYDKGSKELTVQTKVGAQSAANTNAMAFGYVLGGTGASDGFHAHSGINKYYNAKDVAATPNCTVNNVGCSQGDGISSVKYSLGVSTAQLLKDPLWYASKWGGFVDSDGDNRPNLQSEWDSRNNSTGASGSDGIPDSYFYASNPRQLEESLDRAFKAILERTSSGTAAAVVSNNVSGEGALYQAYYEPLKKNTDVKVRWLGTVQALWLDSYGQTRQDCTPPVDNDGFDTGTGRCMVSPDNFLDKKCVPNYRLDNYCVDQVVETYYDTLENRTRSRIYESDLPDTFTPYSMQGVVKSFSSGSVVMVPNSMEGTVEYTSSPDMLKIIPYALVGTVTDYDPVTQEGHMIIESWTGPSGVSYSDWYITNSAGPGIVFSTSSITPETGTPVLFKVAQTDAYIQVNDKLTFTTKNVTGASGASFSDWTVECLKGSGSGAKGEVNNIDLPLNNETTQAFPITTVTPGFADCEIARLSTYNLKGTVGSTYNQWMVTNLDTSSGKGSSTTSMKLGNDGARTFTVTPTLDWLKEGDNVLVANHSFVTRELYEISYLWNARKQLYLTGLVDSSLAINRLWTDDASKGRYITTWVDEDLDGVIDKADPDIASSVGEYKGFVKDMITSSNFKFFDVSLEETSRKVVDYVRGIEMDNTRNRTIKYSEKDAQASVMRLGDIVNSTPSVVGAPQEAFDLLYDDASYRKFRQQYIDRRIMIYAGANDGLIHAFNGGFYNRVIVDKDTDKEKSYIEYSVEKKDENGVDAGLVKHPLGSEVWAYAPYNLLSHLQWLMDPEYGDETHVYYMDGKPRIFDAKIFDKDDADHPEGWGTVMVIGMNLGGGTMEFPSIDPSKQIKMQSAYVVFDITNPEVEPKLLAEIPMPDGSFSTVYPAVIAFQNETNAKNNWYLMFGTGPDDIDQYTSSQNAKIYLFDLAQLTMPSVVQPMTELPPNCTDKLVSIYHMLECDTQQTKSFIGTPAIVDWDLDFNADTAYFGTIGYGTPDVPAGDDGKVMRFDFNNKTTMADWDALTIFYNTGRPVVAQPVPAVDNLGNHWIYFGTGRYFTVQDKSSNDLHYLYGVKDPEEAATVYPIPSSKLLDVSNAEVYTDGTLAPGLMTLGGSPLSAFPELVAEIDKTSGWKMYLPPIVGTVDDPSTRSITRSALLGGVLFSSVYQPSVNPCSGEGQSRLYGQYYKTGTAYPYQAVLGTSTVQVGDSLKYRSNKFLDLGRGVTTTPAIHSGKGSGDSELKVFTQLSTGEIVQSEVETIEKVRTGRTSWQEKN